MLFWGQCNKTVTSVIVSEGFVVESENSCYTRKSFIKFTHVYVMKIPMSASITLAISGVKTQMEATFVIVTKAISYKEQPTVLVSQIQYHKMR